MIHRHMCILQYFWLA